MPHFKGFAIMNLLLLFFSHIQSHVELKSLIVATTPYFEHTALLTYSLCMEVPKAKRAGQKSCLKMCQITMYFDIFYIYFDFQNLNLIDNICSLT